jgi:hypothetical protein
VSVGHRDRTLRAYQLRKSANATKADFRRRSRNASKEP